jgi:prepilin-type N-terminal cleavage/methylation domain-containing protein
MTVSRRFSYEPDCRGFTLIEVLIAMAIFAVGLLALASLQIRSIQMNASARMQTEETNIAVDWLERLIALPYDDPLLNTGVPHQVTSAPYRIVWDVSAGPIAEVTKSINLEVSVANFYGRRVVLSFIKDQTP